MFKSLALLAALAFGSFTVANASPIHGSLGIAGAGDSWNSTTLNFSGPGMIFFGSGTFSGVTIGAPVFLFTFNYLPATYSTPVPLFIAGDGIDLLVSSVTQGFTDSSGLHIVGTGWLNEGGFDTTFASFILNSSKSGDAVTFQATTTANPVPEPASLALFGTGLLGVVGIARRKFAV